MLQVLQGPVLSCLVITTFLECFINVAAACDEPRPPDGWRLLNNEELAVESEIREECEWDRCRTTHGDWNGDGLVDGAGLFMREDGTGAGLWAFFYGSSGHWEWVLVEQFDTVTPLYIGVSSSPSGSYELPCFDEYKCSEGEERKTVNFANAIIDVYYFEKSAYYLAWNVESKKFETYWFSD